MHISNWDNRRVARVYFLSIIHRVSWITNEQGSWDFFFSLLLVDAASWVPVRALATRLFDAVLLPQTHFPSPARARLETAVHYLWFTSVNIWHRRAYKKHYLHQHTHCIMMRCKTKCVHECPTNTTISLFYLLTAGLHQWRIMAVMVCHVKVGSNLYNWSHLLDAFFFKHLIYSLFICIHLI